MSPPPASPAARSSAPRRRPASPAPRRRRPPADLAVVDSPRRWVRVLGPIALGSVFAVLLLMAMFHALIVQGQRELDRIADHITTTQIENDRLVLELARKESPQRIVAEARSFGMVDAPEVHYLSPEDNGPASSATAEADAQP